MMMMMMMVYYTALCPSVCIRLFITSRYCIQTVDGIELIFGKMATFR